MLSKILSFSVVGIFFFFTFRAFRTLFQFESQNDYRIEEKDIVADLPGARLHLNMPAA